MDYHGLKEDKRLIKAVPTATDNLLMKTWSFLFYSFYG